MDTPAERAPIELGLDTFGDVTGPVTRAQFDREAGPDGSLYVAAPETLARKIAATMRTLGLARFDMKYSNGALPHEKLLASIELYGTRVVPLVREALGET